MRAPLSLRLAARELRGGLKGFRIFLACLVLGVAAIAGVGSVSSSVVAGLKGDARILLGGDVELHLVYRRATQEQLAWLEQSGTVAQLAGMRAMARAENSEQRSLIELKAVADNYPLYGQVGLNPAVDLKDTLAQRNGVWGAALDPVLLERLGLGLGDRIRVGEGELEIRATIAKEPDASGSVFVFGPRVMVAPGGLEATGLIQPGTLVGYDYRLRFPPGTDIHAWVQDLKKRFPDAGWRIREFGDASPAVQRFLERVALFLTLVGLTALLVGGVGVGNAVRGYLGGKTATIATLKCLGAPSGLIFRLYLVQVLLLAALGIGLGLLLGAAMPMVFAGLLAGKLPIAARIALYPAPLALAATFGLLVTLAFTLWPLGRAGEVPPARLFRDTVSPAGARPPLGIIAAAGLSAVALAALAILTAEDRKIAAWTVFGAAAALAAFRLAAWGVMVLARLAGRPRRAGLRLALANLYRPGAPTPSVVVSLGLGLTVLVTVALIEGNLLGQIRERLVDAAPAYFFVDLQPNQVAEFDRLIATTPGVTGAERVPMLRGRIARLGKRSVDETQVAPEAQWAVRSERGLTYAAKPPSGSRIVAGSWWPEDYRGPPLVSFDAELAKGMGLEVGDTITVNVLGRELTATIANLRAIDWASMGINFTLVFAPGALEGAPQTFVAAAYADPEAEERLQRVVTDAFPNVSAIRVKDALAAVSRVLESVGAAIRITAAVTLAAGALVLAGAIAAGHRRRVYDAVVLKVLGATRLDIGRAFLVEYGLLGLVTAAIAGALGALAAYLVVTQVMKADFVFLPGVVAGTALLSTALTVVLGFAGTWRALGAKAAPLLRNE